VLRIDEQIDQVHLWRAKYPPTLSVPRACDRRHLDPRRAIAEHDVENPFVIGRRLSALDVEHLARRQHDRQRRTQSPRRAVLENVAAPAALQATMPPTHAS